MNFTAAYNKSHSKTINFFD